MDKIYFIMLVNTPWAGTTSKLVSAPDVDVNDGELIDDEDIDEPYEVKLVVDSQAENPTDFPPCDIHGPSKRLIFSERFIQILNKLGIDNIQYFPIKVTYEPTGEELNYKVANIIGIVSGLDREKSDLIIDEDGDVLGIKKMSLDEEKLAGNRIFRLEESIMRVVVHRSIKEAVEAAGLTGFLFVTDDEYKQGMI